MIKNEIQIAVNASNKSFIYDGDVLHEGIMCMQFIMHITEQDEMEMFIPLNISFTELLTTFCLLYMLYYL